MTDESKKELKRLLCDSRARILSMMEKEDFLEVLNLLDGICDPFKRSTTDSDLVRRITPYDNEVSEAYHLREYINASFVPTCDTMFIAAQFPKESKKELFLDLLESSGTELIVSLLDNTFYFDEDWLKDRKTIKCAGMDLFADEVYNVRGKTIRRLRCLRWEDFSVLSEKEMKMFHGYFDNINKKSPVLIHCFAGVGRTGTFIAYHIFRKMKSKISLDTFVDVLVELRSRRAHMVSGVSQLLFLRNVFVERE